VPDDSWCFTFALVFAAIVWVPPEVYYGTLSEKAGLILQVAFLATLGASAWAASRRQRGAWPATAGALISALPSGVPVEANFFPTLLPLLVGLLCAVALRCVRSEGERRKRA
jgi:peptidoglycan/LPS O-acetylase OafA/YrhL